MHPDTPTSADVTHIPVAELRTWLEAMIGSIREPGTLGSQYGEGFAAGADHAYKATLRWATGSS